MHECLKTKCETTDKLEKEQKVGSGSDMLVYVIYWC